MKLSQDTGENMQQRERISPSEKAFVYKMKYDAIKRKAGWKNCGQVDHQIGKRSVDIIGELCGDSGKQVQRCVIYRSCFRGFVRSAK